MGAARAAYTAGPGPAAKPGYCSALCGRTPSRWGSPRNAPSRQLACSHYKR